VVTNGEQRVVRIADFQVHRRFSMEIEPRLMGRVREIDSVKVLACSSDVNPFPFTQCQQIFVARDDQSSTRLHGAFQDMVIVRIATDTLDAMRNSDLERIFKENGHHSVYLLSCKTEFALHGLVDFGFDEIRNGKLIGCNCL